MAFRICSCSLSISCAIILVFLTRIFRNLDLGTECALRCKAMELESLRRIVSARDNFGKFIHPETKTLIRKLERIVNKLYRQNLSLLFNEMCLNEQLLPNYIYMCVCVCRHWIQYKTYQEQWLIRTNRERVKGIHNVNTLWWGGGI